MSDTTRVPIPAQVRALFDRAYRQPGYLYGSAPGALLLKALEEYPPSANALRALDAGCGEGRDSVYLAKNGWEVEAIDLSPAGIKKMVRLAKGEGVLEGRITPHVGIFQKMRLRGAYDLVLCTNVLNFVPEGDIHWALENLKGNALAPEGLNVVSAFTVKNTGGDFPYRFAEGELKAAYLNGWTVLNYNERFTEMEQHGQDGKLHKHHVAEIIARRLRK